MRLWFRRNKHDDDPPRASRQQTDEANDRPQAEPPSDDPIKNWETPEQAFLRQSGDPFLDG